MEESVLWKAEKEAVTSLFKEQKYEEAIQGYGRVLELLRGEKSAQKLGSLECGGVEYDEEMAKIEANLAQCHLHQEDPHSAIAACNNCLALHPGFEKALFRRGQAHKLAGHSDMAQEDFKKCYEVAKSPRAWQEMHRLEKTCSEIHAKFELLLVKNSCNPLSQLDRSKKFNFFSKDQRLCVHARQQVQHEDTADLFQSLHGDGEGDAREVTQAEKSQRFIERQRKFQQRQSEKQQKSLVDFPLVQLADVKWGQVDVLLLDISETFPDFLPVLLDYLYNSEPGPKTDLFRYLLCGVKGRAILSPFATRLCIVREFLTAASQTALLVEVDAETGAAVTVKRRVASEKLRKATDVERSQRLVRLQAYVAMLLPLFFEQYSISMEDERLLVKPRALGDEDGFGDGAVLAIYPIVAYQVWKFASSFSLQEIGQLGIMAFFEKLLYASDTIVLGVGQALTAEENKNRRTNPSEFIASRAHDVFHTCRILVREEGGQQGKREWEERAREPEGGERPGGRGEGQGGTVAKPQQGGGGEGGRLGGRASMEAAGSESLRPRELERGGCDASLRARAFLLRKMPQFLNLSPPPALQSAPIIDMGLSGNPFKEADFLWCFRDLPGVLMEGIMRRMHLQPLSTLGGDAFHTEFVLLKKFQGLGKGKRLTFIKLLTVHHDDQQHRHRPSRCTHEERTKPPNKPENTQKRDNTDEDPLARRYSYLCFDSKADFFVKSLGNFYASIRPGRVYNCLHQDGRWYHALTISIGPMQCVSELDRPSRVGAHSVQVGGTQARFSNPASATQSPYWFVQMVGWTPGNSEMVGKGPVCCVHTLCLRPFTPKAPVPDENRWLQASVFFSSDESLGAEDVVQLPACKEGSLFKRTSCPSLSEFPGGGGGGGGGFTVADRHWKLLVAVTREWWAEKTKGQNEHVPRLSVTLPDVARLPNSVGPCANQAGGKGPSARGGASSRLEGGTLTTREGREREILGELDGVLDRVDGILQQWSPPPEIKQYAIYEAVGKFLEMRSAPYGLASHFSQKNVKKQTAPLSLRLDTLALSLGCIVYFPSISVFVALFQVALECGVDVQFVVNCIKKLKSAEPLLLLKNPVPTLNATVQDAQLDPVTSTKLFRWLRSNGHRLQLMTRKNLQTAIAEQANFLKDSDQGMLDLNAVQSENAVDELIRSINETAEGRGTNAVEPTRISRRVRRLLPADLLSKSELVKRNVLAVIRFANNIDSVEHKHHSRPGPSFFGPDAHLSYERPFSYPNMSQNCHLFLDSIFDKFVYAPVDMLEEALDALVLLYKKIRVDFGDCEWINYIRVEIRQLQQLQPTRLTDSDVSRAIIRLIFDGWFQGIMRDVDQWVTEVHCNAIELLTPVLLQRIQLYSTFVDAVGEMRVRLDGELRESGDEVRGSGPTKLFLQILFWQNRRMWHSPTGMNVLTRKLRDVKTLHQYDALARVVQVVESLEDVEDGLAFIQGLQNNNGSVAVFARAAVEGLIDPSTRRAGEEQEDQQEQGSEEQEEQEGGGRELQGGGGAQGGTALWSIPRFLRFCFLFRAKDLATHLSKAERETLAAGQSESRKSWLLHGGSFPMWEVPLWEHVAELLPGFQRGPEGVGLMLVDAVGATTGLLHAIPVALDRHIVPLMTAPCVGNSGHRMRCCRGLTALVRLATADVRAFVLTDAWADTVRNTETGTALVLQIRRFCSEFSKLLWRVEEDGEGGGKEGRRGDGGPGQEGGEGVGTDGAFEEKVDLVACMFGVSLYLSLFVGMLHPDSEEIRALVVTLGTFGHLVHAKGWSLGIARGLKDGVLDDYVPKDATMPVVVAQTPAHFVHSPRSDPVWLQFNLKPPLHLQQSPWMNLNQMHLASSGQIVRRLFQTIAEREMTVAKPEGGHTSQSETSTESSGDQRRCVKKVAIISSSTNPSATLGVDAKAYQIITKILQRMELKDGGENFIPFPICYPQNSVLFRGLGDRDGKAGSFAAVSDLLTNGFHPADNTKSNAFGQSSSRSGLLFFTHELGTASNYLSADFTDGALVAVDSGVMEHCARGMGGRIEREVVVQQAVCSFPVQGVRLLVLPGCYEEDLRSIYSAQSETQLGPLQLPDFQALAPQQIAKIAATLRAPFADGKHFMDRVAFFRPQDFACHDLDHFVLRKLQGSGVAIASGKGLAMVSDAMLNSMLGWEVDYRRTDDQGRSRLSNVLSLVLPDVVENLPLCSLQDVFEKLDDLLFYRALLALDDFLPRLLWVQDLVAEKVKMHPETFLDDIHLLDGGGFLRKAEQLKDNPGKSLLQKLREVFRPIPNKNNLSFYVETDSDNKTTTRLLYRLSMLGVFFPDLQQTLFSRWQIELDLNEYVAALAEIMDGSSENSPQEVMTKVQDVLEIYLDACRNVQNNLSTSSIAHSLSPRSLPDGDVRTAVVSLLSVKTASESPVAHARIMDWRGSENAKVAALVDIAREVWGSGTEL